MSFICRFIYIYVCHNTEITILFRKNCYECKDLLYNVKKETTKLSFPLSSLGEKTTLCRPLRRLFFIFLMLSKYKNGVISYVRERVCSLKDELIISR